MNYNPRYRVLFELAEDCIIYKHSMSLCGRTVHPHPVAIRLGRTKFDDIELADNVKQIGRAHV